MNRVGFKTIACRLAPHLHYILYVCNVKFFSSPELKLFLLVCWDRSFLSVAWPTGVQLVFFFVCPRFSVMLFGAQGSPSSDSLLFCLRF